MTSFTKRAAVAGTWAHVAEDYWWASGNPYSTKGCLGDSGTWSESAPDYYTDDEQLEANGLYREFSRLQSHFHGLRHQVERLAKQAAADKLSIALCKNIWKEEVVGEVYRGLSNILAAGTAEHIRRLDCRQKNLLRFCLQHRPLRADEDYFSLLASGSAPRGHDRSALDKALRAGERRLTNEMGRLHFGHLRKTGESLQVYAPPAHVIRWVARARMAPLLTQRGAGGHLLERVSGWHETAALLTQIRRELETSQTCSQEALEEEAVLLLGVLLGEACVARFGVLKSDKFLDWYLDMSN
ncbi:hypothetical protein KFL_005260040 [Klebsormidium nitens]|uniref:Uncharacterized protein n=1 Tax=Klebsormidium nitens TaxID=105231 RepID=A0A1Y1IEX1_KLENI|nr:hypothetical protein KFL_005260040 [Klebsormidium nitens]|eukprot:GAQ89464.1 hypothetical protein KFL_005260040 [Klebsormidium nitens]